MANLIVTMNSTGESFGSPESWKSEHTENASLPNFTLLFSFGQRMADRVLNGILIAILCIVMVSLGCTMQVSKIKTHFWNPKGVAIAVAAQYGIMPLTAFALGKLFHLGPTECLVVLICGCCPGGNLSNIYSLASKGDMNLRCRRTVCMETGCQKMCCSALPSSRWPLPDVIGPLFFFAYLYMVFQLGEGILLLLAFRIHEKIKNPNGKCSVTKTSLQFLHTFQSSV